MKRKLILAAIFSTLMILTACSNDADKDITSSTNFEVVKDQSQEKILAQQEAERLFNKLLNIEKYSDDKELMRTLDDTVYFPSEYLKSLSENKVFIEKGEFDRISGAHRDVVIKKAGEGHYFFNSYVTIEKRFDKESKPQSTTAKLQMELKNKEGKGYRVVRLQISPK